MNQLVGECRTYSALVDTHDHPYAQLLLTLQGELFIETPEADLVLDESRLVYLPPHCQHSFFARNTNQFVVLDIPRALVQANSLAAASACIQQRMNEQWRAVRNLIREDLSRGSPSTGLRHLTNYALALLQDQQMPRGLKPRPQARSQQHILDHYDQPLTLEFLAQLEGYTVGYFCEWFKKGTGQTPNAYLQQVRLDRAKELLAHSELTILEIAQTVGYEHHASLTRLFRQQESCSPQQYRQHSRILDKG
ncbi:AraC family transcriptional regulator [Pseudanabaena sp. FACHB-2040]|uniref:helix-turn-helix transcriptional regulator n=1 Tax=Pseudanabaena sp. FACHB-2040 TaxID=2692859 RepID=UPI0016833609|nr:AraC family transcriptional regulator [Pseudanabaena sp. FACHB-2040]MBD2258673.1 helix-turn-helix transcriptional regulator [Pseudanabaena sp. FACHB-2040]